MTTSGEAVILNVANAAAIVSMFAVRGVEARLLRVDGAPPLVVADVPRKGAKQTIAFYAHYDGQPVDPAQWTSAPWKPEIRDGRLYARSSSDDKSPIIAMLAALDAVRGAKIAPSVKLLPANMMAVAIPNSNWPIPPGVIWMNRAMYPPTRPMSSIL